MDFVFTVCDNAAAKKKYVRCGRAADDGTLGRPDLSRPWSKRRNRLNEVFERLSVPLTEGLVFFFACLSRASELAVLVRNRPHRGDSSLCT